MAQYLGILALAVLGVLFVGVSLVASSLLGPSRRHSAKSIPYECGIVPTGPMPKRFPVRFYLVAMIFIIFDIEVIFIYPWAVIFGQLRLFGLVEMVIFALPVVVSLLYLVSNGALEWGPPKRLAEPYAPSGRTSESTVRRVHSPGEAA